MKHHQPVLLKEVLTYLDPQANENFVDATIGFAGHSLAILEKTKPQGKILGLEKDGQVLAKLKQEIGKELQSRLILEQASFNQIREVVEKNNFKPIKGILFDLGLSLWHLEQSQRGFSFQKDERLDMRFDPQGTELTAEKIVNYWSAEELTSIFKEYGQERWAKRIAQGIVEQRRQGAILTTRQLSQLIAALVPRRSRIHPATRVFQALRIAVNQELSQLEQALPLSFNLLRKNSRLVIISFHSLEDRLVKRFFQKKVRENRLQLLTKKPIRPSEQEKRANPRSRSAKLRAGLKI